MASWKEKRPTKASEKRSMEDHLGGHNGHDEDHPDDPPAGPTGPRPVGDRGETTQLNNILQHLAMVRLADTSLFLKSSSVTGMFLQVNHM